MTSGQSQPSGTAAQDPNASRANSRRNRGAATGAATGTSGTAGAADPTTAGAANNTAQGSRSRRGNLPQTASELPLMIFVAFGALMGAGAIRALRASL
jgi:hypothetical protein